MTKKSLQILKQIFYWSCICLWTYFLASEYIDSLAMQRKHPVSSDFYKFYLSGKLYLNNESMYWFVQPDETTDGDRKNIVQPEPSTETLTPPPYLHPNLNPPTFTLLISPLARLDFKTALTIWSILSILSGLASVILIHKNLKHKKTIPIYLTSLALAFFSFFPTLANFQYGQVSLFLLLIITLAWLALRQEKLILSGIILSLAISIKPFIGLFILTLAFFRLWKPFFSCLGSLSIILVGSLIMVGKSEYETYLSVLKTVDWLSTNWNASIYGFFSRILGGTIHPSMFEYPFAARIASLFFSFLILLSLYISAYQLRTTDFKTKIDSLFSITIPAMLLTSPLGWLYYFPMLLITGTQLIQFGKNLKNSRTFWLLMSIPVLIISTPSALIPCHRVNIPKTWIFDASVNFYALLVIFIVASLFILRLATKGGLKPEVHQRYDARAATPQIVGPAKCHK